MMIEVADKIKLNYLPETRRGGTSETADGGQNKHAEALLAVTSVKSSLAVYKQLHFVTL